MAPRKTSEASSPLSLNSEEKESEEPEEYEEEEVEEEVIVEEEVEEEEEVESLEKEEALDGGSAASIAGSLNNLRSVNDATSEFFRQYDGLQHALDVIRTSIEEKIEKFNAFRPQDHQVNQASDPQMEEKPVAQEDDRRSELEIICDAMGSRALRRYVASRLSDVERLREEVPAALQRAPNPPKLVLGCMGRFYLQGSKAYTRESDMVSSRRSCVLILEFYLLSGCASMKEVIFEEARVGALAWKARILSEGGYNSASEIDALGLILFLASFGIPREFGTRDFYVLLQRCDLNSIINILRRSTILIDKMPGKMNSLFITHFSPSYPWFLFLEVVLLYLCASVKCKNRIRNQCGS
ncbi:Frigida-like protein [Dioscorea alata]|uniref:Frigida-like protein n=1 Tax=Dioscorea alata TaxID=55571 RepID=A0ACB7U096_DIOAL|nr:Frigida-like protein [Dioscorea alata]